MNYKLLSPKKYFSRSYLKIRLAVQSNSVDPGALSNLLIGNPNSWIMQSQVSWYNYPE